MNVLITHLRLDYPGGSETYTYTLATDLLERGYRVTVVSPILGEVAERIHVEGTAIVDELSGVQGHPDVMHCTLRPSADGGRTRGRIGAV